MSAAQERDEAIVGAAMKELAADPRETRPLPDPYFIWWKAQLLRRLDAERRASEPIEIGERVHIGAAFLGAIALAAGAWSFVPASSSSTAIALVAFIGAIVLVSAVTFAAWDDTRGRKHGA